MKTIHWLVPYENSNLTYVINSNLASIRLRLLCVLNNKNYKVTFGDTVLDHPDYIVIGKIGSNNLRADLWLEQISRNKKSGTRVILDYTDNHLNFESSMSSFYHNALTYIDASITSSSFLANELNKKTKAPVEVIPDAIEVPILKPRKKLSASKNILYFGHASNINYLIDFIDNWSELNHKITIFVLTNEQGLAIFNQTKFKIHENLSIQLGIWSVQAMINTSQFCDLAIIPSNPNDPRKAGVSSNRLITALALGLPTAADIMDSYKDFSKYFTDIRSKRFIDLLGNPDVFYDQVLEAQEQIVPKFTQEEIGRRWMHFFFNLNKQN